MKEIMELMEAHIHEERRRDDIENQRTSWFTSHIMNASGNYKKRIEPSDLYKPLEDRTEKKVEEDKTEGVVERFSSKEHKEEYLKKLTQKFGKEQNTDGSQ
jgi:hypothetical protein